MGAEVFLDFWPHSESGLNILRGRGGVSCVLNHWSSKRRYSPWARRCFSFKFPKNNEKLIFSVGAEVFLITSEVNSQKFNILRGRGGVSLYLELNNIYKRYSPWARRCFSLLAIYLLDLLIFSVGAEVFLSFYQRSRNQHNILRGRGGVSDVSARLDEFLRYSPWARRCFSTPRVGIWLKRIFSVGAEVFLICILKTTSDYNILRGRGGVSLGYNINGYES